MFFMSNILKKDLLQTGSDLKIFADEMFLSIGEVSYILYLGLARIWPGR